MSQKIFVLHTNHTTVLFPNFFLDIMNRSPLKSVHQNVSISEPTEPLKTFNETDEPTENTENKENAPTSKTKKNQPLRRTDTSKKDYLINLSNQLGSYKNKVYLKEPDCLHTLKLISKNLQADDNYNVKREKLLKINIIKHDLIPIIASLLKDPQTPNNNLKEINSKLSKIFSQTLRILVNLTQSTKTAFKNEIEEGGDKNLDIVKAKRNIEIYKRNCKISLVDDGFWECFYLKFFSLISAILEGEGENGDGEDNGEDEDYQAKEGEETDSESSSGSVDEEESQPGQKSGRNEKSIPDKKDAMSDSDSENSEAENSENEANEKIGETAEGQTENQAENDPEDFDELNPFEQQEKIKEMRDNKLEFERILIFLKNILKIKSTISEEQRNQINNTSIESTHDKLIQMLEAHKIIKLLLFIMQKSEFEGYNLSILEIILQIFKYRMGLEI